MYILLWQRFWWLQGKRDEAIKELLIIKDGSQLNSKECEEAALMFVKVGRTSDGYKLFQQAISGKPETRFYAGYCGPIEASLDNYNTALAVIEANLGNKTRPDQLTLETKQAVLLLVIRSW